VLVWEDALFHGSPLFNFECVHFFSTPWCAAIMENNKMQMKLHFLSCEISRLFACDSLNISLREITTRAQRTNTQTAREYI